jgi:sec-independent protein translocase protein TatB
MFNLGMGEITVILLLALIFLGPSKLPELATGLGRIIRQIRKATADVKNEIILDDTFRKPFEELRDAVTLSPEELKRRDQIKQSIEDVRRQAEELARSQEAQAATAAMAEATATPPPEPIAAAIPQDGQSGQDGQDGQQGQSGLDQPAAPWPPPSLAPPPPPPPAAVATAPGTPPLGTFPRSSTPAPLTPGRIGGPQRVTPPISSLDGNRANITQVLSEDDLRPAKRGTPPPPPLPGLPPPPPLPGTKKG